MATISVSAARQTLPAQLDRVEAGEEIAISRHGQVVAVLVHPDVLKARRAPEVWSQAEVIGERLDAARREPLRGPAIARQRADELIESVREGRSAR